jgi:hypothetical protein
MIMRIAKLLTVVGGGTLLTRFIINRKVPELPPRQTASRLPPASSTGRLPRP